MKISAYEIVNELNKLSPSIKKKLVKIENGKVVRDFDPEFPVSILNKIFEETVEEVIIAEYHTTTITDEMRDVVLYTNYVVKADNRDLAIDICKIVSVLNKMNFYTKKALVGRNTDPLSVIDKTLILDDNQEFVICDYEKNRSAIGSFCFVAIMNTVLTKLGTKKEIIPKANCDESNLFIQNLYFVID